jgi:hypothetical protein
MRRTGLSGVKLSNLFIVVSIALLAAISYLPTLGQPFIEDDYPNIALARVYGPVTGWAGMARDRVNRVRATTFVMTHWIERVFGLRPVMESGVPVFCYGFRHVFRLAHGRETEIINVLERPLVLNWMEAI